MKPAVAIVLLCLAAASAVGVESGSQVVARVNGAPITRDEFGLFLPHRSDAVAAARDSVSMLLFRALDRAIEVKLQKLLAVASNFLDDAGYETFRMAWQNENVRRKAAKERNEVVYGPIEFTERAFYDYQMSKLALQLRERYAANHPEELSEERIQAAYDALRGSTFRRRDAVRIVEVTTSTTVPEMRDAIRNDLANFNVPESLMSHYPCEARALVVDDGNARNISEDRPALLAAVDALRSGDVSPWHDEGRRAWLVQCIERTPGGAIPLDEVRNSIRTRLLESAYNQFMSKERSKATVEIDRSVMDSIVEQILDGQR